jgi:hypothetical protein
MKYFFSTELPINADHFWRIKDPAEYMNFIKEETPFKQLEIIEKLHKLDIEQYDEFLYAVDCLKSSISWN